MAQAQTKTQEKKAVAPADEKSISERFCSMVMQQFQAAFGNGMKFTPYQKELAQHLYLRIDHALQEAETKRIKNGEKKSPYTWENINLPKLAIDAVHRINLGLDGLIDNHISPVAYWNSRAGKYNLNLQIGYVGKDYYRRKMAIDPPVDVIYELIYSKDEFTPIKKDVDHEIETYKLKINNPWDRGEVVGGFGYIIYSDPKKNKLIPVSEKDFQKSESCAPSKEFWKTNPIPMRYKTIVHRTTDKIPPDPEKINKSYMIVEQDDIEETILGQIEDNANKKPIDIKPDPESDQKEENTEQVQEEESTTEQKEETGAPQQQSFSQPKKGPGF